MRWRWMTLGVEVSTGFNIGETGEERAQRWIGGGLVVVGGWGCGDGGSGISGDLTP